MKIIEKYIEMRYDKSIHNKKSQMRNDYEEKSVQPPLLYHRL